jgi:hypothetical protein
MAEARQKAAVLKQGKEVVEMLELPMAVPLLMDTGAAVLPRLVEVGRRVKQDFAERTAGAWSIGPWPTGVRAEWLAATAPQSLLIRREWDGAHI